MGVQPADDSWLTPGMILLDKYRVESILGKGGMGIVVCAFHPGLNEHVAIKILRDDLADPDAGTRFRREAQATARLKNEHVARVSDVGTTEAGMSYMVMELLDGVDIGQMLNTQLFEPPDAVSLVLQACEALAEAHSVGIVHRDIKPTNLFVVTRDERPLVKVLDFGISKVTTGTDGMSLTQTQSMLGTPAYMSPEQMRSARTVDARSDVWSIGTVLYEMIEGHLPFSAENFSEMIVKVSVDPPTPPAAIPPSLAAVVMRCLEKSADDRYASILELAQALAPFARDGSAAQDTLDRIARYAGATTGPVRPVSAPAGSPVWSAAATLGAAAPLDTIDSRVMLATPGRRWVLRGVVAAMVLGLGIVALGVSNSGGGSASKKSGESAIGAAVPDPDQPGSDAASAGSAAPSAGSGGDRVGGPEPAIAAGSADAASAAIAGGGSAAGSAAPSAHAGSATVQSVHKSGHTIPHGGPKGKGPYTNPHATTKQITPPTTPPPTTTPRSHCSPFDHPKGC